jgi:NADPH:quinone reductase-like Zn-dependent oxidoreductase
MTHAGGPDVLTLVEEPIPQPATGEVVVEMVAAGLAYGDMLKRQGLIPGMPPFPYTPGYDVLGVVCAIGSDVGTAAVGDTVAAFVLNGGHASHVTIPADRLVSVPAGVNLSEGACIPLNYVTAYQMLHRAAMIKPGEQILVHGAAGGVGTALLQLAQLAGVTAYGTVSAAKQEIVEQFGGIPIDYHSDDFVARIMELTMGKGVDAVFDPIGGAHLGQSQTVLRSGGRLIAYGISSVVTGGKTALLGTFGRLALYSLLPNGKQCVFYGISGSKFSTGENITVDMTVLFDLLALGKIEPVIGATFPLSDVAAAHALLESGHTPAGKILLTEE